LESIGKRRLDVIADRRLSGPVKINRFAIDFRTRDLSFVVFVFKLHCHGFFLLYQVDAIEAFLLASVQLIFTLLK